MDPNTKAFFYLLLLFSSWLLIPLLPAWITYRITPNQRLGLSGPFEGVTVRAGGAFAAYLALLLLSYKFIALSGLSIIGGMALPSAWVFKADIVAIDEQGKRMQLPEEVHAGDITFKPGISQLGRSGVIIRLPYNPEDWPALTVTIPNFGGAEVDLSNLANVELDHFKKTAELQGPIIVRRARGGGAGVTPQFGMGVAQ